MTKIIDLTHTIKRVMPTHSFDKPSSITKTKNLADDKFNDWYLSTSMHIGTHIDGPGHLTDSNILMSDMPIEKFVGKGYLIDARNKPINASLLNNLPKEDDLIVLILTGSNKKFDSLDPQAQKEYFENHPIITKNFALKLAKHKIKMVGIDFFSPDKYPFEIHKIFFENNILIAENLTNLEKLIDIKSFNIVALPLKTETDSSLARIIAIL